MNEQFANLLRKTLYVGKAVPAPAGCDASQRWLAKPVSARMVLNNGRTLDNIENYSKGTMQLCECEGRPVIRMEYPAAPEPADGTIGWSGLCLKLKGLDCSAFNRISVWVRAECSGLRYLYIFVAPKNGGVNRNEGAEGYHSMTSRPGEWTRVVHEIPHFHCDAMEEIAIYCVQSGAPEGTADEKMRFYLGEAAMEAVEADTCRGWDTENRIAYCHSGYFTNGMKFALTQVKAPSFRLEDAATGLTVHEAPTREEAAPIGTFTVMDFTPFQTEGVFRLRIGGEATEPFRVDAHPFDSAFAKALNYFAQERCGTAVDGVHEICHLNVFSRHPDGRRISIAGGWHDAGDLSQAATNSSEVTIAALEAAAAVRAREPELADRLLAEARWGLQWLLRTAFGDGYRPCWTQLSVWTRNIEGAPDDVFRDAARRSFSNLETAAAEAKGAIAFQSIDPYFADWCLRSAIRDFKFGMDPRENEISCWPEYCGAALLAASTLYDATGDGEYLRQAAPLAQRMLACQQTTPVGDTFRLSGYFNQDETSGRPTTHNNEREHITGIGLIRFAQRTQDKALRTSCFTALRRYCDYLRALAKINAPYGLLPAHIHDINEIQDHRPANMTDEQMAEADAHWRTQLKNGVKMDERRYLRRMPVPKPGMGYFLPPLSRAKIAAEASGCLGENDLRELAVRQIEWILGLNPFSSSCVYGEGYNCHPLYVGFSGQFTGALPCGIKSFGDDDAPYWPTATNAIYKEVCVIPASLFLWLMANLEQS